VNSQPGKSPAGPEPGSLKALQRRLGYTFRDPVLLDRALTHPSCAQEGPASGGANQRLEFLGDAVLQLVVTQALYELYPGDREGPLTTRRAALTKGAFLSGMARAIGLDACLRLGPGEETTGGRDRSSALEDAFEALVGALHLDAGLPAARDVVLSLYGDIASRLAAVERDENPKGRLQELIQPRHGNEALRYEAAGVGGADHAREFEASVRLNGAEIGRGRGSSKKLAEEAAARAALGNLGGPGA
jgi:ribonuclease-3